MGSHGAIKKRDAKDARNARGAEQRSRNRTRGAFGVRGIPALSFAQPKARYSRALQTLRDIPGAAACWTRQVHRSLRAIRAIALQGTKAARRQGLLSRKDSSPGREGRQRKQNGRIGHAKR